MVSPAAVAVGSAAKKESLVSLRPSSTPSGAMSLPLGPTTGPPLAVATAGAAISPSALPIGGEGGGVCSPPSAFCASGFAEPVM